jgi:branched-chain amino acid transport system ATP-binding protein
MAALMTDTSAQASTGKELMRATGLVRRFGGLVAVNEVALTVADREIVGLIGPNGAGKTSLFNILSGQLKPDSGSVSFAGKDITGASATICARAGIGRTFQIVKPFAGLSVLENVMVGGFLKEKTAAGARAVASSVIRKLNLEPKADQPASSLTLPDRKRLEVARALATRPRLLLLDEVMAGLRPTECDQMVEVFRDLNRSDGTTILLIEHVMRAVMALAQHIGVLHHGEVIARGTPQQIVKDQAVLDCYLGEETEV